MTGALRTEDTNMRCQINPPALIFHAVLLLVSPYAAIALACVTVPLALITLAVAPFQGRAI
jgi:hypothetical protein